MSQIHQDVFDLLMEHHKMDDNFLFAFRQINRAEKLDKGYWFLGGDDYLAVSFWRGTDWKSKTPRIFFEINKHGNSSLEFRNSDVSGHNDFFDVRLLEDVKVKESYYGYSRKFKTKDYIESLKLFLKNEKPIIDKYIKSPDNKYTASEYAKPMEFIYPGDFNKQLEKIKTFQKRRKDNLKHFGSLKNIEIQNFGPIKNVAILNIPLKTKWIYLTGENGSGKTSVLKAIATGLCQNNDKNEPIASRHDYGEYEIRVQLHTENNDLSPVIVTPNSQVFDKKILTKGFACYGPIRIVTDGASDIGIINDSLDDHDKATFGLFNPIGVLKDLSGDYPFHTKAKYQELYRDVLISNLLLILPNIFNIEEDRKGKLLFFESSHNTEGLKKGMPFEKLPSGTRSFVSLIMDLLIRLNKQQPDISDLADYTGVVLIDEIDIHLHPKLQLELINQLSDTFPKLQFIVSTHSPIPLLGAPQNAVVCVVKIDRLKGTFVERVDDKIYLEELLPNTILTSPIFGMDNISNENRDKGTLVRTEETYSEVEFSNQLDKKINEFLTSEKENELIKRFENKRK